MEPAKSPKKEQSAPTEKHIKAKTEQTKEEVGSASSKKAVPGKKEEKTTKTVEQEIRKEKSGKTSSVLKDKEPTKEKEAKVPASLKEKEDLLISTKAKMIPFQDYNGNVIDRGEKQNLKLKKMKRCPKQAKKSSPSLHSHK
ncbi:triadin-like [Oryx dammah]|uniref:triadin-like n=1 Tax=Oryx dammah TaxID=59534 RepID=UPI001A9AA899|nr:triadin-like [Oryx dammah]